MLGRADGEADSGRDGDPDAGSNPGTPRSGPKLKAEARGLSHSGAGEKVALCSKPFPGTQQGGGFGKQKVKRINQLYFLEPQGLGKIYLVNHLCLANSW